MSQEDMSPKGNVSYRRLATGDFTAESVLALFPSVKVLTGAKAGADDSLSSEQSDTKEPDEARRQYLLSVLERVLAHADDTCTVYGAFVDSASEAAASVRSRIGEACVTKNGLLVGISVLDHTLSGADNQGLNVLVYEWSFGVVETEVPLKLWQLISDDAVRFNAEYIFLDEALYGRAIPGELVKAMDARNMENADGDSSQTFGTVISKVANKLMVGNDTFEFVKLLGHGKGGYSYLVRNTDGTELVLKQIHHEPCSYYTFGDKMAAEQRDYQHLADLGIPIPELLAVDLEKNRLLKEYIPGDTISSIVEREGTAAQYVPQVKDMCASLYPAHTNIDYYPTNFIVNDGKIYYIDYECNSYSDEWNFENWGIKYWLGQE